MSRICKVNCEKQKRIVQGDIYRNVEVIEYIVQSDNDIEFSKLIFPKVVVLTQDCDLTWDFEQRSNDDKKLISILIAPIYNIEHFYNGEHLSELHLQMSPIKQGKKGRESTIRKDIKNNKNDRYHYIEVAEENIQLVPSVVDFKHFYTVNRDYLYSVKGESFVCRLSELYREDLSRRFANFFSRIALPDLFEPIEKM